MTAFVVFTDSRSVIPGIVGPFADEATAEAFMEGHPRYLMSGVMTPIDGGYAAATVVCADTATSPEAYRDIYFRQVRQGAEDAK